jgi:hypothetical protein
MPRLSEIPRSRPFWAPRNTLVALDPVDMRSSFGLGAPEGRKALQESDVVLAAVPATWSGLFEMPQTYDN